MPGPAPKNPSTRTRRNKTSTNATLKADAAIIAPELPEYGWHVMTVRWWADIWSSPMAPEFDDSDRHGLFQLAMLVNDFWMADKPRDRRDLAAEIRQQGQRFGLSPIDRRRLQWEIEKAEDAKAKGSKRAVGKTPATKTKGDTRSILHSV